MLSVTFVFFSINLTIYWNFLLISTRWKIFIKSWQDIENKLTQLQFINQDSKKLNQKVNRIFIGFMLTALIEHSLSSTAGYFRSQNCVNKGRVEAYFRQSFTDLFLLVPYSLPLGVGAEIITVFCGFSWNFIDLYLISISQ